MNELDAPEKFVSVIWITHCMKNVRVWSFSGPYFPAFGLNTERYGIFLRIQTECSKIWTRKTPNADAFQAATSSLNFSLTNELSLQVVKLIPDIMLHALFIISNNFISNAKLNLAKNQANAKQHSWGEH